MEEKFLKNKVILINGILVSVSDEVYSVYTKSQRKLKYFTEDLKKEKIIVNQEEEKIVYIASREDSYDRLIDDNDEQFAIDEETVESQAIKHIAYERLHKAIAMLSKEEQELINSLYFEGLSERKLSRKTGIPQRTINDRKRKILKKIKNILKN